MKTIYLAGGCFWCTEAIFQRLHGVESVMPGYTGGTVANPTYEQVCGGMTGHAEAIKIVYDEATLTTEDLLVVFLGTHDPTTLNRQDNDIGTEYRSGIYYFDDEQKNAAEKVIATYQAQLPIDKAVTTELLPAGAFFDAEDYYQNYYNTHKNQMYCQIIIDPKVEKLEKNFADKLKDK